MANVRITKTAVDAAQPDVKDTFHWDEQLKGFGLKVTPKGKKVYICQYRVGGGAKGVSRRQTIGTHGVLTPEEARAIAKQILGQAASGFDPANVKQEKRKQITVTELCDKYLLEGCGTKKPSTVATDRGRIERHIKPLLGRKKVPDVTRADVKRFLQDVADGKTATDVRTGKFGRARVRGGRGTATRTVGLLGGIFSFARDLQLIEINPVQGVKRFPDKFCNRFLDQKEVFALGNALEKGLDSGDNPAAIAIIRLLIFTGARSGEINQLRWPEVDFEHRVLRLPDSKTGQKIIPLNAGALALLAEIPRHHDSDLVFPSEGGSSHYVGTSKVWRRIREDAGLGNVRLHDLRHSFASFAVSMGASLPMIGALLGQRNSATTQRYAHLSDDPLRSITDGVSRRIDEALGAVA